MKLIGRAMIKAKDMIAEVKAKMFMNDSFLMSIAELPFNESCSSPAKVFV